MREWFEEMIEETLGLQVAPLIDVVFLLLIYFLVTASLQKQESDLGISLPATVVQARNMVMPDEQIIEIDRSSRVIFNNKIYGRPDPKHMRDLVATLSRYRQAAQATGSDAVVTIQAADEALHDRVIDVLNACAGAGIRNVSFGMEL